MHDGIRAAASNSTNCLHISSWKPTKVRLSSAVVCAKLTALQTAANSLVSDSKKSWPQLLDAAGGSAGEAFCVL